MYMCVVARLHYLEGDEVDMRCPVTQKRGDHLGGVAKLRLQLP